MIVLTDDENRENEGDLVLPAQFATPEAITFMLSVARGYLCLSLTEEDCDRLELSPQAHINTSVRGTAFTVSIDGHPRHGFTTGVSAKERAKCIQMAIDRKYGPEDFVRPGHINPLRSRMGGTLVRTGQTEGSVDLCRMAGLYPAACIIEVMRDDGEMARVPDLIELCRKHAIKMCSVAQIIEHRLARESLVRRMQPYEGRLLRTEAGEFRLLAFESLVDPLPHVVLTRGDVGALPPAGAGGFESGPVSPEIAEPVLVRMHRKNLLGDVFGDIESSRDGPTGDTLRASMKMIVDEGRGAIVYLRGEQAGNGLDSRLTHVRRGALMPGSDTPDLTNPNGFAGNMPHRELGIGSQILRNLGIHRLRLITDHAKVWPGIEAFGLEIAEHVPVRRA